MSQVNQNVRSGNNIIITLDGHQVGVMKSLSCNDDYSPEPVTGIGDIHVQEHVPTVARHSLSASVVVLKTKSLRQLGVAAINGDWMLQGLVFDIVMFDKQNGTVLRKYMGCTYASGSMDVSANAIVMESASFMALDVSGQGG